MKDKVFKELFGKHIGRRGGLASALSKGNLSQHDYLVKLGRANQELLKATIDHKLSGA